MAFNPKNSLEICITKCLTMQSMSDCKHHYQIKSFYISDFRLPGGVKTSIGKPF